MVRKPLKPRNPLAVPARLRKAGPHGPTPKARRRADKMKIDRTVAEDLAARDEKDGAE